MGPVNNGLMNSPPSLATNPPIPPVGCCCKAISTWVSPFLIIASIALLAGAGNNTLVGPDFDNLWELNATNGGKLNTQLTYSGIANLVGGALDDEFFVRQGALVAAIGTACSTGFLRGERGGVDPSMMTS